MPLFTFVLEFDGGTHISQFRAASVVRAVHEYGGQLLRDKAVAKMPTRRRLSEAFSAKKRVQRVCRAISEETGRGTIAQTPQSMVEKLNRILIGWANYFCLGAVSKAYSAVDVHTRRRLRRWLCDKYEEARPGYKRFPEATLHSVYGLVQLPHRTASLPWASA